MSNIRRLPPFEIREGEAIFIHWHKGSNNIHVQLRLPSVGGKIYTSRADFPIDLFRRPPSTGTADWIRQELIAEQRTAIESIRTNRKPRKPRW